LVEQNAGYGKPSNLSVSGSSWFRGVSLAFLQGLVRSIDDKVLPVERMTIYHAFMAATKRAEIEDYYFS